MTNAEQYTLAEIFKRLREHEMQVNLAISELLQETLTLLGFELIREGSRPNTKRLEAILKMVLPKDKKKSGVSLVL